MAGTIVADDLQHSTAGSVGTEYVVKGSSKVWHNQSADGTTVNGSFNLSSLTDMATGNFQVNVTSSLANANYAGSLTMITNNIEEPFLYLLTTSSYRCYIYDGGYQDGANTSTIQGELA